MAPSSTARSPLAMNISSTEESVSLSQHTPLHLELAAWIAMPSPAKAPGPLSLETHGQRGFVSFNWSTGQPAPYASPRAVPTPSNTSSFGCRQGPGPIGFIPSPAQTRYLTSCSAYAQSVPSTARLPTSEDSHPTFSRPHNRSEFPCRMCPQGVVNAFDPDNSFARCRDCRIQTRLGAGWSMSRACPECQVPGQLDTDGSPSSGLAFSGPTGPSYAQVSTWVDDLVGQSDDLEPAETSQPTALPASATLPTPTNTPNRSQEDIYAYAEYLTRSSDPRGSCASPLAAEEPVPQLEESQIASPKAPSSPAASFPDAAAQPTDSYYPDSEAGHEAPPRALSSPAASILEAASETVDSYGFESDDSQNASYEESSSLAATLLEAASQIVDSLKSAFERGHETPPRAPSSTEVGYAYSTGSSESETSSSYSDLLEPDTSDTAVPYQYAWLQPSQDFFFAYRKMPTEVGVSWEDVSNIIEAHLKTSETMSPKELMAALEAHKNLESKRKAQSDQKLEEWDDAASFATVSCESVQTDESGQYEIEFRVVDDSSYEPIQSSDFEDVVHSPHQSDLSWSPEPTQLPFARLAFGADLTEAEMEALRSRVVIPDNREDLDSLPDLTPLPDAVSDVEYDDELSGYDGSVEFGDEALEDGDEDLEHYEVLRNCGACHGGECESDTATATASAVDFPTLGWAMNNVDTLRRVWK
ncbi:hypothetical protein BKA63DRAFT_564695 [Paraphoma chrysanthemicola]|nr:hypothetical protein BKA63DRAFT_564695 [Paraphoma chrysanthemicola]